MEGKTLAGFKTRRYEEGTRKEQHLARIRDSEEKVQAARKRDEDTIQRVEEENGRLREAVLRYDRVEFIRAAREEEDNYRGKKDGRSRRNRRVPWMKNYG